MKKINLLSEVQNFGLKEEYEFVRYNKAHEAYQIRHSRNVLIRFLCFATIKEFYQVLEDMTQYTVDLNGLWHYNPPRFVFDEVTRGLLIDLKNKISK